MSAAVASAQGDAFRPQMIDVQYKIVMTNATIRTDAVAVLTAPFASRLAEALVSRRETVMTRAAIRRRARAVGARWDAERYAITIRVLRVTVIANANAGCVAGSIIPARERVAGRSGTFRTNA